MIDRITLTIPRERPFHRIAHLVLGGLAVRLDLTLEYLEDLQLALGELLEQEPGPGELTVELAVAPGAIEVELGPFTPGRLRAALERDPGEGMVGLSRVLATVVDDVALVERDGGEWARVTKAVPEPAKAAQ